MNYIVIGKKIILDESKDLERLSESLDNNFIEACELIKNCKSYVVVCGIGKSGHIGKKISATFSSTGTPSIFLHPAEASHGDLGVLKNDCVLLAISNSGESKELLDVLIYARNHNIKVIGITSKKNSTLGNFSNIVLELPFIQETGKLNLAPTSSTTMTLALGDALAMAISQSKNFTENDFGRYHPGGKLGRKLAKIKDIMRPLDDLAIVEKTKSVSDTILKITEKSQGCALVVENKKLIGLITDGDLRRHMLDKIINENIMSIATLEPVTILDSSLCLEALELIKEKNLSCLPVVNKENILLGLVTTKDLIKMGF